MYEMCIVRDETGKVAHPKEWTVRRLEIIGGFDSGSSAIGIIQDVRYDETYNHGKTYASPQEARKAARTLNVAEKRA